jgi:ABC-type glycerol-3-phosphate transport system substrate-binding protein
VIGLFVVYWLLNHYVLNPPKDPSVNITINSLQIDTRGVEEWKTQLKEDFPQYYTDKTEIQVISNMSGLDDPEQEYASTMKMIAMMAANEVDIFVGDFTLMYTNAFNSYMMPLDDIFTEEELEQIEALAYVQEDAESGIIRIQPGDLDTDGNTYLMEERPYMIDVSHNTTLRSLIAGEPTYIGISSNTLHLEEAKELLWYFLTGE